MAGPPASAADRYTHGHHTVIVASHARRTASNSAAFLLPHLHPGREVLDVGCGPGSITIDLAERVAPSLVVGVDREPEVLAGARAAAGERGVGNVRFEPADVYELPFPDDSFDVVFAHQLLQHLTQPGAALAEMTRVARPRGIVAARDADFGTMVHAPHMPLLDRWLELYHQVARSNGAEPDGGRYLRKWALDAGLVEVEATASAWHYAEDEERRAWAELWAVRITEGAFAGQAVEAHLSDRLELGQLAGAWRAWAREPGGFFAFLHGEVLARAPEGASAAEGPDPEGERRP
jgi:ubiquinone/menaquinone biosynthesis C-methylase UbiE